jgi:DNA-directed RNA polymerase specialized sigma24 family protein
MERATARRLLPDPYAQALALHARGVAPTEIADRLGVDITSVKPLLGVARAKLAALEALEEPARPDEQTASRGRPGSPPAPTHDSCS